MPCCTLLRDGLSGNPPTLLTRGYCALACAGFALLCFALQGIFAFLALSTTVQWCCGHYSRGGRVPFLVDPPKKYLRDAGFGQLVQETDPEFMSKDESRASIVLWEKVRPGPIQCALFGACRAWVCFTVYGGGLSSGFLPLGFSETQGGRKACTPKT